MADYPIVRFVSEPSIDATVRFDFNPDGDVYTWHDGFSLGAPKFLGAADSINPELGLRQAQFGFSVRATQAQLDSIMTSLARELMRPRNWLRVQRRADAPPRWLHTYASAPDEISWAQATDKAGRALDDTWNLTITADADPDIWGAEETLLSSVAVTGNPLTGGCFRVLPAIKGDVPAMAKVSVLGDGQVTPRSRLITISAAGETSLLMPTIATWSTVGSAVVDASYLAGSYRPLSTVSTTNVSVGTTASFSVVPGRAYRVMLRVGSSGLGGTLELTARLMEPAGVTQWGPQTTPLAVSTSVDLRLVDLGTLTMPQDSPYISGASAQVEILARRITGTASLYLDGYLQFVPVGDPDSPASTSIVEQDAPAYLDGDTLTVMRGYPGASIPPRLPGAMRGQFPYVFPGADNAFYMFKRYAPDGSALSVSVGSDLTASSDVTITYHPRYLQLPGS